MKTIMTNNRKFLKLFFLAIGLCSFSGMKAQWSTYGEYVTTNFNSLLLNVDATDLNSSEIVFKNPNGPWSIVANKFNFTITNDKIPSNEITTPFKINKTTSYVCIGCDVNYVPTNKLHVDGAVRAGNALMGSRNGDYASFGNVYLNQNADSYANYALLQGSNGATFLNATAGTTVNFRINNVDQAIVSNTKINFLNNVGIGIGTATPTHVLQVGGGVRATDAVIINSGTNAIFGNFNALNNTGGAASNYSLKQGPNGGSYLNASTGANVHLTVNDVPEVIVSATDTKILNNLIVEPGFLGPNNHIAGVTSFGAEKMVGYGATVSVDGRLIISDSDAPIKNLTTFASENYKDYLLWVQEGIVATDFAITTLSQWPDYVFNKEYKLNTLNEVASFIKENGHLPTMPSAKEIEEKGFTVSDITKRTVKTIEELTLHTIEQQKLIENQAQSIQNQAQLIESLAKRLNALEGKQ